MEGFLIGHKHWRLASALLLAVSFAGFGLGQQVGHLRQQPASRHVAFHRAANIAGNIGSQSVTTTSSAPIHHTSATPSHTQAAPSHMPTPQPEQGKGHQHGHGHGHKDDGSPKARHRKERGQQL